MIYILGSVHATKQYLWDNIYYKGDILETLKKIFRDVIDSALSGLFDCIAHLDYIKYHIPYKYWRPELLEKEIEELLDAIQSEGICMEVNTAGLLFTPPSLYPDDFIIKMAYERGIPVVVSSDAHSPDRVGAGFKEAYEKLLSIGYEEVNYFSKRKRHSYKIKDALKFL
ncbi:MAG: PHP domain-containing protein [Bdellovibrionota bacterium]